MESEKMMCFTDMMAQLRADGIMATEQQVRWAIKTGRVTKPKRDGSLRFIFTPQIVNELITYFESRTREPAPAA
jgi:hypothetical protein